MYTAESTGASMERTKMPNLWNGSKGGFEPGLTWLRVRHSIAELSHVLMWNDWMNALIKKNEVKISVWNKLGQLKSKHYQVVITYLSTGPSTHTVVGCGISSDNTASSESPQDSSCVIAGHWITLKRVKSSPMQSALGIQANNGRCLNLVSVAQATWRCTASPGQDPQSIAGTFPKMLVLIWSWECSRKLG